MTQGSQDRIGQQLGNYHLLRHLGRGGFADVYLGEHIYLKSQAALKLLHTRLNADEQAAFLGEAQMLVRMHHPHIVRVLDFALDDDTPFLVMDYAPGGTLRQRYTKGTRLSLETFLPYVQQVASALQYAHDQRLIHRDIKPENMLLGTRDEVLLSDFGLAILAAHTESYSTHAQGRDIAGTSLYLAPEQLQGRSGPESDQYGLAIVVYEWLCGRTPFRGTPIEIAMQHLSSPPPSLQQQVPDLSPDVEAVVLRALSKEPHDRFEHVYDFVHALEQASGRATTFPSSSLPSSPVNTPPPSTQGQPAVPISVQRPEPLWKVPITFTSLIGREQEVARIRALLLRPDIRLLTLLGMGGIGKTRLSLQVAREMRHHFSDGVCFVSLAAIRDPELVVPAIAQELGIPEIGTQSLFEQVRASLHDKQLLLILDNFEQVVSASAQIEELSSSCLSLKIVVTSRAVLHLQAEQQFTVPPLALPNLNPLPAYEILSDSEAVALFVRRAQAIQPDFHVTADNARPIAEICVRLDGLPLAIELAAARIKLLPPQVLLARLTQRFQVLTSGLRTLPERQQTLRNTLRWSYDLLEPEEQRLFRQLSLFVGGWTLEAVEAVVSEHAEASRGPVTVLDGIASLLDKSLLLQVKQEGSEPRLIMLETVREYGLECVRESGEAEVSQHAHALYYLSLAEQAEPHFRGAQQLEWLDQLEMEQENLRAALGWLLEHEREFAVRLGAAMWWFWYVRGYRSEGWRWLEAALASPSNGEHTAARAKALCGAGRLASCIYPCDFMAAHALLEESATLYRELEDTQGLAGSLGELGWSKYLQNNLAAARTLLQESIGLAREVSDKVVLAYGLRCLSVLCALDSNLEEALPPVEESVALCRELGDTHGLVLSLTTLSRIILFQGNLTQAAACAQESLSLARKLHNKPDITDALYALANVEEYQGNYEQAEVLTRESLMLARELGAKNNIADALSDLGAYALYRGDFSWASTFLEECLSLTREIGSKHNIALTLNLLGEVRRLQGEVVQAATLFTEGLELAREVGSKYTIGCNLIGLAKVAAAEGQFEQAACLFGASVSWLNPTIEPELEPWLRDDYYRAVESVREHLGEEAYAAAWERGLPMTPEQALAERKRDSSAESLSSNPPSTLPAAQIPSYPDGLTRREGEVLRLVALGWSDAQVAEHLVISPRTVNGHLRSIYTKINVNSRAAATRYAMEHALN